MWKRKEDTPQYTTILLIIFCAGGGVEKWASFVLLQNNMKDLQLELFDRKKENRADEDKQDPGFTYLGWVSYVVVYYCSI